MQAASWWEWEDGPAPFFWIWYAGYLVQARDGVSPWIKEIPLIWMRKQRQENDPSVSLKVFNNMDKLVARVYITEGVILAPTPFFYVPKETDDIRMVFDLTLSGLNDYLWALKLMLLSMGSLLMIVDSETHMVDLDVGEIFYNFQLS